MTIRAVVETEIGRRREEVAAFAMDPAHDAEWIAALTTVRRLDDGPFGVGSRVERVARFLGRDVRYTNEVLDYDPPARLVMQAVSGPFPMRVTYEFEPGPSGDGGGGTHPSMTLARIVAEGDPGRFFGLARPLVRRMVARNIARDLRRLKERLEGAGA